VHYNAGFYSAWSNKQHPATFAAVPKTPQISPHDDNRDPQLVRLGLAIKARREALSLTQEKLAGDAQIERAHMSKIERGRQNITIENLLKIATALNATGAEVLADAGL
jgi:DNA-binding XRE family transcriptional regulator